MRYGGFSIRRQVSRSVAVAGIVAVAVTVGATLGAFLLLNDDSPSSGVAPSAVTPADRWAVAAVDANAPYLPTLANQDVAAGANRLSFTVQDARGVIRGDLSVQASLYDLERDRERPVRRQFARFIAYGEEAPLPSAHSHAEGASLSDNARNVGAGVYVVPAFFERAGLWGLELAIAGEEGEEVAAIVLFRLQVREQPQAPGVGEAAPPTRSRTLLDVEEVRELTSDRNPEPGLYQVGIGEALERARPFIVAFATPAYCHSRTCGPTLEVVKVVWREFAGRLDGIHVEVFENPQEPEALRESQAFRDWHLPSEPWVFVVDAEGRIAARFEGTITQEELRAAVNETLGQ